MKAIKITTALKESNNEMFESSTVDSIVQLSDIPNSFSSLNYNEGQRTDGYDTLDQSIHQADGFFDLIEPEFDENQKLGSIYFDQDKFTFEVLELTPEEKKALLPKTVSQRQLRTQLVLNGFELSSIENAIAALPDQDEKIARIAWEYAGTFERESVLLVAIAGILGLSEIYVDQLFLNASKL